MLDILLAIFPFLVMLAICAFQKDSKAYLKKFFILFFIGMGIATIPWLHFGVLFGYYAYTLNAAFLASIVEFKKFEKLDDKLEGWRK